MNNFPLGSPFGAGDIDGRITVYDTANRRPAFYPVPLALLYRTRAGDDRTSLVGEKLFHALLFLCWNQMSFFDPDLWFGYAMTPLRRAIGQGGHKSNGPLKIAFQTLCCVDYELPVPGEPDMVMTGPLLSQIDVGERDIFWRFSESVWAWCCSTDNESHRSPYVFHDLEILTGFRSISALRLYETALSLVNRTHPTASFGEAWLRGRLDVANGYASLSDFRSKILAPSAATVSANAPFKIKIEEKRLQISTARGFSMKVLRDGVGGVAGSLKKRAALQMPISPISEDSMKEISRVMAKSVAA